MRLPGRACSHCGSPDLIAARPGQDADAHCTDPSAAAIDDEAWCADCWPARAYPSTPVAHPGNAAMPGQPAARAHRSRQGV